MKTQKWRIASANEIKHTQITILKALKEYCEKHDITFFLMYGTLLGAIRHQGMIPWDDDVDVCMLRPNYERFIATFNNEQSRYTVKAGGIDKSFPYYFAKISDPFTRQEEPIDKQQYDTGINIDLFPMDNVPSDPTTQQKMWNEITRIRDKLVFRTIDRSIHRVWYKQLAIKLADKIYTKKSTLGLYDELQRTVKKYANFTSTAVMEIMTPYGKKSIIDTNLFGEVLLVPFEDTYMPVPAAYDQILTQIYGDYMVPPPIEKRITHHTYCAYVLKIEGDTE